jgi:hypothetical protein
MGERIGGEKLLAGRKEEQRFARAVSHSQLPQRVHHGLHAVLVGGDGQHAKGLPAEMALMLLGGIGGEIDAHPALEAGLQKIGSGDRHGAAVSLDHEAAAGAVRKSETESSSRTAGNRIVETARAGWGGRIRTLGSREAASRAWLDRNADRRAIFIAEWTGLGCKSLFGS